MSHIRQLLLIAVLGVLASPLGLAQTKAPDNPTELLVGTVLARSQFASLLPAGMCGERQQQILVRLDGVRADLPARYVVIHCIWTPELGATFPATLSTASRRWRFRAQRRSEVVTFGQLRQIKALGHDGRDAGFLPDLFWLPGVPPVDLADNLHLSTYVVYPEQVDAY